MPQTSAKQKRIKSQNNLMKYLFKFLFFFTLWASVMDSVPLWVALPIKQRRAGKQRWMECSVCILIWGNTLPIYIIKWYLKGSSADETLVCWRCSRLFNGSASCLYTSPYCVRLMESVKDHGTAVGQHLPWGNRWDKLTYRLFTELWKWYRWYIHNTLW